MQHEPTEERSDCRTKEQWRQALERLGKSYCVLFGISSDVYFRLDGEGNFVEVDAGETDGKDIRHVDTRRRLERALRESEEKFQIIFNSVPDSVSISSLEDARYLFVNTAFCKFTGFSREEIVGKTAFDLNLYVDPDARKELIEALGERGVVSGFELKLRMRDGRIIDALLSGKVLKYAGKDCLVVITKDITAFNRTQAELRRSEKRYRDLFNSVSDLIYTQDLEGRFTSANRAMTSIFGYTDDEFLGRKAADFMKPEFRKMFVSEYLGSILEKGFYNGISSYFAKDGRKIYLEYRSNLIRPKGGKAYISGIARDVTDRVIAEREIKKLNRQVLQAQKMEAVGTLAGGVAHDFNNLLQGILGYTQYLVMSKEEGDPDIASLREIEKAGNRASELTQQLLTFSRKVEGKPKLMNLNREVEQVEKLLKRTIPKMIAIRLEIEENLDAIYADPAQLEQVLMNLCVNARDAMPEGGELVIGTKNVTLSEGYCRRHLGASPGKYVLLTITDTGTGMDRETREHIFDPFFTTKEIGKGSGLGLAMVYGIVKSHKGFIVCYSEPGRGTAFKIYLPAVEGDVQTPSLPPKEKTALHGGSETILLVDDEKSLRGIGKEMLEKFGYRILLAKDGEEAIEIFIRMKGEVELVILDLMMPGMGGKRCLEELLKIEPRLKVIIASGYSLDGHVRETLEAGARDFVSKPYKLTQMLQAVRQVLDE